MYLPLQNLNQYYARENGVKSKAKIENKLHQCYKEVK